LGIKLFHAKDQNSNKIDANEYNENSHTSISCCGEQCNAALSFVKSHLVKYSDTTVNTKPFFKLQPKQKHKSSCPFHIKNQISSLANKTNRSHLIHLDGDQYMFSLLSLEHPYEPKELVKLKHKIRQEQREKKNRSFLSLLEKILLLRYNSINNKELLSTLLLDCHEKRVRWDKFYFDVKNYDTIIDLYAKKIDHTIALHGIVKSVEEGTIFLYGPYTDSDTQLIIKVEMSSDILNSDIAKSSEVIVYGKPTVDTSDEKHPVITFDLNFKEQLLLLDT
jgi:hypothetical protein